jgi:hypothetical protein
MTTQEQLTTKEIETVKTLIRLGDSEELAIKTVLEGREKAYNSELYRIAYES